MENDFGKFLSEKRKEAQLTQKELSEKLFVSESTISKWEKNKANPDISMIGALSSILKVSEHELIVASEDKNERRQQIDAHKWRTLSSVWNMFFLIVYGITLLSCFICNLAVNKALSWFWIVLFSVILAMSFTTVPRYIKKYKLLVISLTQLLCLILLFLICNIYTNGSWFLLATVPCCFGFIVIFLPIYISKYNFPTIIKTNRALFSIIIDSLFLIFMLKIICQQLNENWFLDFALPLAILFIALAVIFVCCCSYLKISKLFKSSILVFLFIPFMLISYFVTKKLCLEKFNLEISQISLPNFTKWSTEVMINSNIYAIILFSIFLTSLLLAFLGLIFKIKSKNTNNT